MKYTIALLAALIVTACTTTDEIVIDRQGVDSAAYERDLAECRSYSAEVKTSEKGARGAASGAAVGGLIGAIAGGGAGAARGAGIGAVTGGTGGLREGGQDEVQVVKRCLAGRGYRVLN